MQIPDSPAEFDLAARSKGKRIRDTTPCAACAAVGEVLTALMPSFSDEPAEPMLPPGWRVVDGRALCPLHPEVE